MPNMETTQTSFSINKYGFFFGSHFYSALDHIHFELI